MNNRPPAPSNGSVGRNSLHSHHHRPHLPQRTSRDFDGDNNDDSPSTNNGINTGSYGSSPPKSRLRPYHSRGGGSFGGERACYNCGGSGHMARDCPEPRNERSGGGGRDAAAPPPPPPPPPPPRDYRRGNQHSSSFHSSDQQQRHGQTPSNFDRPNSNYQKSPHNSNIMQQTPSPPNLYNSHPNTPHHQQQQHQQNQNAPIPPDMRRTLILSNVPPHLSFKDIMKFFGRNWNAQIQFAHVDKTTGDAYVKFAQSQDARRVWEEGRADGLDGRLVDNAGGSEGNELSLAAEGVGLKAFHFNNKIITSNEDGPNNSNDGFDRKRSWGQSGDRGQQREIGAGGRPYSQPNKAPRYTSEGNDVHSHNAPSMPGTTYQPYDQYDGSNPPPPPSHPLTADTNSHLRHQNPHKQHQQLPLHHNKLSPLQIQALQQKDEEQQLQWQKFQKEEEEWRQRRYAEYQAFLESQRQRTAQVSKFEEKRDLLTKQESMLAKQLPLHKKILQMLKTKKASVSEQSSKMKEILSTQTRITELKKETKELVEGLETLKEEEKEKGVFIPSEKRPVFAGVGGGSALGKRSLDRRTTVLKVEGFEEVSGLNENNVKGKEIREGNATETALKEHFSTCGVVSCVTVKNVDNEDSRPYALVDFVNRIDAERAKASDTKFNGNSLTFKWHHQSSISATSGVNPDDEVDASNVDQFDETYTDDNLYNDIDGAYDGGEYSAEVEAAPQFRHEGDDEHMVDYDYEDEGYDED